MELNLDSTIHRHKIGIIPEVQLTGFWNYLIYMVQKKDII